MIPETLEAIWSTFCPLHMKIPEKKDFHKISKDFFDTFGVPHCLGALDSRHIRIIEPSNSGTLYFNYKKFYSIVLQAVVDARCKFLFIDVGAYGSQHDAITFESSEFYRALLEKKLDIPQKSTLPGTNFDLPYFFVADGAFPSSEKVMKPFTGANLPEEKANYNKKISCTRVVVENAFGLTCQKWRIFYTTINLAPSVVELIVKATCILHNILIDLGEIDVDNFKFEDDLNDILLTTRNPEVELKEDDFSHSQGEKARKFLVTYFENF